MINAMLCRTVIPTISHCFGCGRVLIVLVTVIVFVATMSYLNTFLSFLFFFTFHAQSSHLLLSTRCMS